MFEKSYLSMCVCRKSVCFFLVNNNSFTHSPTHSLAQNLRPAIGDLQSRATDFGSGGVKTGWGRSAWGLQLGAYSLGLPILDLGTCTLAGGPQSGAYSSGPTIGGPTVSGYRCWIWGRTHSPHVLSRHRGPVNFGIQNSCKILLCHNV